MNKIESFKYIRSISQNETSGCSVGDFLPIEISWECNGNMYSRKPESGGLCAVLVEQDNMIGIVENPYMGGFNSAYIINGTNQIVWNVSDLFIHTYGTKYSNTLIHIVDVRIENGTMYFIINISNCDFRFSVNIKTGEIGRLIETR